MIPKELVTPTILEQMCREHKRFFYLASPYTNPDPAIVEDNYNEVLVYSWLLDCKGIYHYCPIAAKHCIAQRYAMPGDYLFWEGFNDSFITPSLGIILADIPGWEQSKGVQHERRRAAELNKPLYLVRRTKNDPPALLFTRM